MKRYQFSSATPDTNRDHLVTSLRRQGFTAYRERQELVTDASLCAIGLCWVTTSNVQL